MYLFAYFITYLILRVFVFVSNYYFEHITIEPEGAFQDYFTKEKTGTIRLVILQTVATIDVCVNVYEFKIPLAPPPPNLCILRRTLGYDLVFCWSFLFVQKLYGKKFSFYDCCWSFEIWIMILPYLIKCLFLALYWIYLIYSLSFPNPLRVL